jgi:hypothetical protein
MSFLTPTAFALAILGLIIIAMYLLKLRRTERVVSSTYLWQRMVRDVEANAPWQRVRRNLLLFLQLLFLLTLIFALARPFTWTEGSTSQTIILIFDSSASMAATDNIPDRSNRLDIAKDQARLLISNHAQETRFTIIAADDTTRVLVSSSQDRRLLYQTLDNLHPQTSNSDLTSALELASAIATHQPDAEIVIYSDGRIDLPERLAIQGHVRYQSIGESDDNQAISLITLEPGRDNHHLTAFIQVANYAAEPAQRRLILSADGQLVDAHDLEIPGHGQVSLISDLIPTETEVLEATLTQDDALSLDDQVWIVQKVSDSHNVNLVTQGNRFLETALGLLPGINLSILNQEDLEGEKMGEPSLIIFDNSTPIISKLQSPNLFYVGPISSTNTFSVTNTIVNPNPRPASDDDPLLEYVDLSEVNILDAAQIPLPGWARPVLIDENSGDPLLFVGEIGGRRMAVSAFDPRRSNLPLLAAYPILIANLTDWLLPGRIGDIPNQVTPGQVLTFTPPPEITTLNITQPDGTRTRLEIQDGRAIFADTIQLGVYRVAWGEGQSLAFAVNLFNPQESDILPADTLTLFDEASGTQDNLPQQARYEWWRPLAALALIILFVEWLVYHRATFTKFRYQIMQKRYLISNK